MASEKVDNCQRCNRPGTKLKADGKYLMRDRVACGWCDIWLDSDDGVERKIRYALDFRCGDCVWNDPIGTVTLCSRCLSSRISVSSGEWPDDSKARYLGYRSVEEMRRALDKAVAS